MKKPIRRLKRGLVELDVLALDKAIKAGTLSDADRRTAERLLPGVCDKLESGAKKP